MAETEEREQCWGFSQKRQKWQEVYILPSAWDKPGERIGVAYQKAVDAKEYPMFRSSVSRTEPEELKEGAGHVGMEHLYLVQKTYLDALKNGSKTWEGRIHDMKAKHIKVGDFIRFNKRLRTEVVERRTYKTFEEMLKDIGIEQLLPGCESMETAVETYRNFPRYREDEATYGCIAFRIKESKLVDLPPAAAKARAGPQKTSISTSTVTEPPAKKARVEEAAESSDSDAPLM